MKHFALIGALALAAACTETTTTTYTTSSAMQDVPFLLVNNSGVTLWEFYASPVTVDSWEEDILGNSVLYSGSSVNIIIADGRADCMYDLKMVFQNGSTATDTINICNTASYTIY